MIDQVQSKPTDELTVHLGELLPAKTLAGLRAEAAARRIPLTDLVREVLYYYVAEQTEDGLLDTPDEIIAAQFKEAWGYIARGELPDNNIFDLLAELETEVNAHDNAR